MNNIIMIGLPGSGKTTFGKRLAKEFAMEFIDSDQLITEIEKVTIATIFETKGEEYFRDLETLVLKKINSEIQNSEEGSGGLVLSVGGGVPLREENISILKEIGIVIFIDRSVDEIVKDIRITDGRPLLKNRESVLELDSRRREYYEKCSDIIVKNDESYAEVLEKLMSICTLLGASANYCVIGDPILHSLSPRLHGIVFKTLELKEKYRKVLVKPEYLAKCMAEVRMGNLVGFNVTKPHKISIIDYLDETTDDALKSGAVNTVKRENGRLVGYNTDMQGLNLAIKRLGWDYKGSRVTIMGNGGASLGIAAKAEIEGASKVNVIARNNDDAIRKRFPKSVEFFPFDLNGEAKEIIKQTDILINATPLGMKGINESFKDFSFLYNLPKDALVYDLIYDPKITPLMKAAGSIGLKNSNGLSMLVYQGILADEIFLERELDKESLFEKIYNILTNI